MKIGIITDAIRDKKTGIGYYSEKFTNLLLNFDNKNSICFIDYEQNNFNKTRLYKINNYFQKFFKTYSWHNTLPLQIRKLEVEYILNLSGIPHLIKFPQKEIFWVYDLSTFILPQTHPLLRVLIFRLLLKHTILNSYKIIAISQSTKRDLIRLFNIPKEKIIVLYPALNLENKGKNLQKPINLRKPYILYLGTLEPRKNIETILKAFYQLKKDKKYPHKLIISGKKGWGYSGIYKTVKTLNLEKEVVFTGFVTDSQKNYLYKNADLLIYPSLYEGFGLPVLEAMSHGCPVICSNNSSLPEVGGRAVIQINPKDVKSLSSAIRKVINNDNVRDEMIKEGYKQAKKFSQNEILKNIKKFYKRLNLNRENEN